MVCPDAAAVPESSDLGRARSAVLCLINRERARESESPLRVDGHLRRAAQKHSDGMVAHDYFDHAGPDGESLLERIRASGYLHSPRSGYAIGENIAWGTLTLATPEAIVAAWMASSEHRANILNPSFRDTGIGVVPETPSSLEGQPGATYTQDFGVLLAA
jgi:uncharacterized protein YkwD